MVSFTVVLVSIVISMVVTIGITLCCRFCSEYVETFIISIPKSLSENLQKLRDIKRKIMATNHPKKDNWLLKVDRTLEEARLLIEREYSSSAHNNNDGQRSYLCFGHYDSSPIKLQRQMKRLIVEGQRTIAASAKAVAPDIESGIIVQESLETVREQIRLNIEEDNTVVNETLEQAIVHVPGVSDIREGTSNRKQSEPKHTCGDPDTEQGESSELTGKQIRLHIEDGSTVGESSEQSVGQISGVPGIGEGTGNKKKSELDDTGGFPDIEEGITAKPTSGQPVEQVRPVCIEEGRTKEVKILDRTAEQTTKRLSTNPKVSKKVKKKKKQATWNQNVEHVHDVPNMEDYGTMRNTLSKVIDMLGDDGIWKIGIWGPGGVGKTALVHTLCNKLENNCSSHLAFSLVIYTSGDDLRNIQEAIALRLQLKIRKGKNHTAEVAHQIRSKLKTEKFLLILDDVWGCIDSSKIGIPENHMGSKIVLTTRSLEVCKAMEAEAIRMDYLTDVEAWQLFSQQVGSAVDADGIRPLVETVYNECGGLPLALIAVGSSMRGKTDITQWQNAIEKLQNSVPVDDIALQAYNSLKMSYNSLKNDNLKSCFLYCSLYPKSSPIDTRELVECWLAENLIENDLDYVDAFSEGLELIQKLINCSLLEDIYNGVKMNNMVHHVARWIAESEINRLKWISITENKETALSKYVIKFPDATTVMIHSGIDQGGVLEKLLQDSGPLRVLKIKYLGQFQVSLRDRSIVSKVLVLNDPIVIEELPRVFSLMILDLSYSHASKLPRGIERFTDLKVLNLSYTTLKSVDADTIGALKQLEVLDMRQSSFKWPTRSRDDQSKNATLQDLSKLTCLKAAYVQLADVKGNYEEFKWVDELKSFLFCYGSGKGYGRRIGRVISIGFRGEEPTEIGSFMLHAEQFDLRECEVNKRLLNFSTPENSSSKLNLLCLVGCSFYSELTDILGETFRELRSLEIDHCNSLKYVVPLHGLHMTLPKLEKITLRKCDDLTNIFVIDPSGTHTAVLPNLRTLELDDLHQLQSLSDYELNDQFNCLETLVVIKCPQLKKLPRISSIMEVRGSVRWWNNLAWDTKEAWSFMKECFKPCSERFLINKYGSSIET